MKSLFTDALVLRLTPFREADLVVHLLTRDLGVIALLARGARKSQRRFGGALDYFCHLQADLRPARAGMGTLQQVELRRAFEGVRGDVERYYLGCHFLEVVRRGAKEGDPAPELFDLVVHALAALDRSSHPSSVRRVFQVRALEAFGYGPALASCFSCGRSLEQAAWVSSGQGVLCTHCGGEPLASPNVGERGRGTLSPGTVRTLQAASRLPLDRLGTLRFTALAESESKPFLDAALRSAIGLEPAQLDCP